MIILVAVLHVWKFKKMEQYITIHVVFVQPDDKNNTPNWKIIKMVHLSVI